jgi:hypothetical protein
MIRCRRAVDQRRAAGARRNVYRGRNARGRRTSVKQRLAAIRHLFDWLVPARSCRSTQNSYCSSVRPVSSRLRSGSFRVEPTASIPFRERLESAVIPCRWPGHRRRTARHPMKPFAARRDHRSPSTPSQWLKPTQTGSSLRVPTTGGCDRKRTIRSCLVFCERLNRGLSSRAHQNGGDRCMRCACSAFGRASVPASPSFSACGMGLSHVLDGDAAVRSPVTLREET